MKMLLFAAMVAAAYAHGHMGPEAIATFTAANSGGAVGWVRVAGGMVNISLDLTNFNYSNTTVTSADCRNGITYHIHATIANNMIGDACKSAGGHYDPWFACGGATGSTACQNKGGCIPRTYACSTASFTSNPLLGCEVGDWSGKYGKLMPVNSSTDVYWKSSVSAMPNPSRFEISSTQLYAPGMAKSIVFHCGSPRILCAPFRMDTAKNSSTDAAVQGLAAATTAGTRVVADFGGMDGPLVEFGGGETKVGGLFGMLSGCAAGTAMMTISNAMWTATATTNQGTGCDTFMPIYDPTVQCPPGSASMYCMNGKRCNTTAVNYTASMMSGGYYIAQGTVVANPFPTAATTWQTRYMDQSMLTGRAVVISCGATNKWCAKIVAGPASYTTMVPTTSAGGMAILSRFVVAVLGVAWFAW